MEFNICGWSYQQLHSELEEILPIQLRGKIWTHKKRNYIIMLYHMTHMQVCASVITRIYGIYMNGRICDYGSAYALET